MLIKRFIDEIQKRSKELLDLYYDKDGLKNEEVDVLQGKKNYSQSQLSLGSNSMNGQHRTPDIWHNFYEKIKEAKVVNKKFADMEVPEYHNFEKMFSTALDEIMSKPIFSVEENKGKCVDMHEIYLVYNNLKKVSSFLINKVRDSGVFKIDDYLSFLSEFERFEKIAVSLKKNAKYREYIRSILDYLKRFFIKTHPLSDPNKIQDGIDSDFDKAWEEGTIPGYEKVLNGIRNGDESNKLFCAACKKLFTNETIYEHHLKGNKHIKNVSKNSVKIEIDLPLHELASKEEEDLRDIAYFEYEIVRYKELLADVFETTRNIIRKKQSMNPEEIEADVVDEGELDHIEFNEEDEKKIYNPKNVPLGWDGK
jgi:splicing factor 3A subunit 3